MSLYFACGYCRISTIGLHERHCPFYVRPPLSVITNSCDTDTAEVARLNAALEASIAQVNELESLVRSQDGIIRELREENERLRGALSVSLGEWRAWMDAVAEGDFSGPNDDDEEWYARCRAVLSRGALEREEKKT